jgi:hypothetical protein
MDKVVYEIDANNIITFIKPVEKLNIDKVLKEFFDDEFDKKMSRSFCIC